MNTFASANIRNFVITAHIDHGKSTLADRLLELTETVSKDKLVPQHLDQNPIERERGITIKLAPVRMLWHPQMENPKSEIRNPRQSQNSNDRNPKRFEHSDLFRVSSFDIRNLSNSAYVLNLIDTPGHVDFSYEVSRSLTCVEGAVLLVDAASGIQAQTVSNITLSREQNLTIIPVVNKIDLPNADPAKTAQDMIDTFGFAKEDILFISAKTGENVSNLLSAIVDRIPPPRGNADQPLKALVFDSQYDQFKGVMAYIRVFDGVLKRGEHMLLMGSGTTAQAIEVGVFLPNLVPADMLSPGDIGYVATGLKQVAKARVGDTITHFPKKAASPIPGYKEAKPMVFAALYPVDSNDFPILADALGKLSLNDASLHFEPEHSDALGAGFRVGFLGILHMEVVKERLEREYGLTLIASIPTVKYTVEMTTGEATFVDRPTKLPPPVKIRKVEEPYVKGTVIVPKQFLGAILTLLPSRRGSIENMEYKGERVVIDVLLPLSEIITDFYDQLKSLSSGFASFDYVLTGTRPVEVVRLDILVAHHPVDALSQIVVRQRAPMLGRILVERLKEVIPRQQFEVAIQAAVGNTIVARADVPAYRKNVTAKLYGGDRTRKDKLLEAQKKGKKRMKMVGNVAIPQEAFLSVFKL